MNIQEGYNQWAQRYDFVENKTRDLDAKVTRCLLAEHNFSDVLELGCGTGKNTEWLASRANRLTAVDFSEAMLQQARKKVQNENMKIIRADITKTWNFGNAVFDLAVSNLILEHIQDLHFIFSEAARVLKPEGKFFISELHPSKQYTGSKARFENEGETVVLDCYIHHVSEFFNSASAKGFHCIHLDEWFNNAHKEGIPRLISFLFQKRESNH